MTSPWRTLRGRLAIASLAGLLVASLAFAALGIELVRAQTLAADLAELETKAVGIAKLISQDAELASETGGYRPTPERLAALAAIVGEGTQFTYAGGNLDPDPRGVPSRLQRRALDQIDYGVLERDGVQRFDYTIPETGVQAIAAAAPITFGPDDVVAAVVVLRERAEVGSVWRRFANRVLIAAGIGLAVALIVTLIVTRRALQPLKRLEVAARAVGGGDLETRVTVGGTVEIDALAAAFNTMVRELQHREALTRDFLMRVTHDLRTPLTAIRGHTQALTDGIVPRDAIPRSLHAIEDESARLEALVTDLLDLAKLEAKRFRLELATVDANDLVERAFTSYAGEAVRRGVRYQREFTQLPELATDAARVRQIVGNLIDNAFKWTPDGGVVQVAARAHAGGGMVISVTDTGPGIAADKLEEIFEPFISQNTSDGRHGSGLGLAISRQLARALGGDLRVESRLGRGSRFTLELPGETRQQPLPG